MAEIRTHVHATQDHRLDMDEDALEAAIEEALQATRRRALTEAQEIAEDEQWPGMTGYHTAAQNIAEKIHNLREGDHD